MHVAPLKTKAMSLQRRVPLKLDLDAYSFGQMLLLPTTIMLLFARSYRKKFAVVNGQHSAVWIEQRSGIQQKPSAMA